MTNFRDTPDGAAFIAEANSRQTSPEIMSAIAFFARDRAEADALWNGDGLGVICTPLDLWEHVTGNGQRDTRGYCWGAAGSAWYAAITAF